MGNQRVYAAVTVDIVSSTQVYEATGRPLRPILLKTTSAINEQFGDSLAVPFGITLGDEFQGLVKEPAACPRITHYLRLLIHPLECRVGVGIGEIASPLAASTSEMEGPAFSRSRAAIEKARRTNRRTVYESGIDALDTAANTISLLVDLIEAEWTDKQWEAVRAYTTHGNLARAGRELGITAQGVERRLQSTHWREIAEAVESLSILIGDVLSTNKG